LSAQASGSKRCPRCGEGILVDISFRQGSDLVAGEEIQEADTRQVETYSCGHEVVGPRLDTPAGSDALEVERRDSSETTEPPA
jgi:hypothetical protein